ncbi:MAG: transporter substrate-binding domain-containing protein, partial [Gammaproteobacteria bacterium]|nr:transporter substrate-binding domain-containing protein [Gammaproteobacteria bacterium]
MKTIVTSFITAIVVSVAMWMFSLSNNTSTDQTTSQTKQESAYDRVMRTGKIRCGYANWHPILYRGPESNQILGAVPDLMIAIGQRMKLEIEWTEETSFGHIVEGLVTNRYDVICTGLYH